MADSPKTTEQRTQIINVTAKGSSDIAVQLINQQSTLIPDRPLHKDGARFGVDVDSAERIVVVNTNPIPSDA